MKIGIVGWGVEGQSAYRYFGPGHDYLIVNEEPRDDFPPASDKVKLQYLKSDRPSGMVGSATDLSYLDGLGACDKIVYSPSSYRNLQKVYGSDRSFWDKTTTVQNIFFENSQSKNIIGVTGTKGKGTTATLIAKILEAQGEKVYLGGNIGDSALDFLQDLRTDDWVVLELSSFQLQTFTRSSHIAVCLMIAKEHMDWHADMQEYLEAKANLFMHQTAHDVAIYFAQDENSKKIASYSPGEKIPYFEKPGAYVRDDGMVVIGDDEIEIIHKTEVKLLGEHNLQNICAALTAVSEALGRVDKAKAVLSSFSGLEHRLELVRELEGVKYYDDSFAATPDSAIVALEAIPDKKVIILGGFDRHLPISHLAKAVKNHSGELLKAVLIGASAGRIAEELKSLGFNNYEILNSKTMAEIVRSAKGFAQPDSSIILSPGFASFDMFKNFEDRGNQFKKVVAQL